ncbi:hypothetical protein EON64_13690 [archaeon]|nr:MAG: hypothetical protein EON64_13690 [archaeon]
MQSGNCMEIFSLAGSAQDCTLRSATVHWMAAKSVRAILSNALPWPPDWLVASAASFGAYCERVHGLYVRLSKRKMGSLAIDLQRHMSQLIDVRHIDRMRGDSVDIKALRAVAAADGEEEEGGAGVGPSMCFTQRWNRFLFALQAAQKKRKATEDAMEVMPNKLARQSKEEPENEEQ